MAIFGSILNLYASFATVDPGKIKLIYTFRGSRLQALVKVVLPSSIPAIISNVKVNIGLCLVGSSSENSWRPEAALGISSSTPARCSRWIGS